jgi:N-carbamoylputrescine amidase
VDRNVKRSLEMAELAVEKGAVIIGFPELFLCRWFPRCEDPAFRYLALEVNSEPLQQFKAFSKKSSSVLITPFFESSGESYYNSAAVFDNGTLLGVYRKMHVQNIPLYREQFYFSPGENGFPVFETSRGRIGIQICWDNLFPEGSRILALKGADIIFAPTASSVNSHNLWERAITTNAFANNIFIFRVNRVGQEEGISFYGRSFCANPWGETASELAGSKDAIVLAEIDLKERAAASETWGFLKHRRPDHYQDLAKS